MRWIIGLVALTSLVQAAERFTCDGFTWSVAIINIYVPFMLLMVAAVVLGLIKKINHIIAIVFGVYIGVNAVWLLSVFIAVMLCPSTKWPLELYQ